MSQLKHIFNELHFELVRVIAEGGMGIVYEAEQRGVGDFVKRVAVKLIREEYSKIDEFRSNFVGEARLVADLIHTNIVQTYHLGEISGQYFMTMEYVDGVTLEDFIQRHRETKQLIPTDLAAFIVSRICRGLSHAHQHCDTSGRNLGRTTHKNILELSIPNFIELRSEIDPRLDDILQHGFKRDRDKRYQSAQAMLTALETFLYDDGYGPTNEKLAAYMSDLLGEYGETAAERWLKGATPGLEETE